VERVLALLPDPFTRKHYERLMRGSTWTAVCSALPITGTIHPWNDSGDLIDSRPYTQSMTAGNSWAADNSGDPDGTWSESTPSPGH
jgi:hypothetical protein